MNECIICNSERLVNYFSFLVVANRKERIGVKWFWGQNYPLLLNDETGKEREGGWPKVVGYFHSRPSSARSHKLSNHLSVVSCVSAFKPWKEEGNAKWNYEMRMLLLCPRFASSFRCKRVDSSRKKKRIFFFCSSYREKRQSSSRIR